MRIQRADSPIISMSGYVPASIAHEQLKDEVQSPDKALPLKRMALYNLVTN